MLAPRADLWFVCMYVCIWHYLVCPSNMALSCLSLWDVFVPQKGCCKRHVFECPKATCPHPDVDFSRVSTTCWAPDKACTVATNASMLHRTGRLLLTRQPLLKQRGGLLQRVGVPATASPANALLLRSFMLLLQPRVFPTKVFRVRIQSSLGMCLLAALPSWKSCAACVRGLVALTSGRCMRMLLSSIVLIIQTTLRQHAWPSLWAAPASLHTATLTCVSIHGMRAALRARTRSILATILMTTFTIWRKKLRGANFLPRRAVVGARIGRGVAILRGLPSTSAVAVLYRGVLGLRAFGKAFGFCVSRSHKLAYTGCDKVISLLTQGVTKW